MPPTDSKIKEILTPDQSACRYLLDIVSEDEYVVKESANFLLSEPQLIRIIAQTFQVVEVQVSLNVEDKGCCGIFKHDGTRTINDISINNVKILTYDIDIFNLLRDSYKISASKGLMAVLSQIH
ncbi:MAG: hypothetical protein EZS28_000635 [Streblomastix strix]|uniref:Uncharacterized protein n=1 Tax=Streblomastix strix TaxID=222440 RepID=A0A5J4XAB2_9EUKA|nr:MAG: hypothetical protein EZS28_000635 [Streblomastix strix]